MKKINQITKFTELFDLYKEVLTEKQRVHFEMYYFEDMTFEEIAEDLKISKNAVYDSIKKAESTLIDLEEKIGFKSYIDENK